MRIKAIVDKLKEEAKSSNGELLVSIKAVEEHLRRQLNGTSVSNHDYTGGE